MIYRGWHPFPFSEDAIVSVPSPRSRSDGAATRLWAERLQRFAAGSHTVVAFCAAEGVSQSIFYLWRRRLAQSVPSSDCPPTVVPLRVDPSPAHPIELAFPSGATLRSPSDVRPEMLVAVLRRLEERPC